MQLSKMWAVGAMAAVAVAVAADVKTVDIKAHDSLVGRRPKAALIRREGELLEQHSAVHRSAVRQPAEAAGSDDTLATAGLEHSRSMKGFGAEGMEDVDGDEGDYGYHRDGEEGQDYDHAMEQMVKHMDPYTVWDWERTDGAIKTQWLEYGCPSLVANTSFMAHSRFEKADSDEKLGYVQCCGNFNGTEGTKCMRRDSARNATACFGEKNLQTFMDATNICNEANMRLCTKEELQTEDSLGCCSDELAECDHNQELVWTSTHDYTDARKDNEHMEGEIATLQEENVHLEDDHESMREDYRLLVAQMQEYFNEHPPIPPVEEAEPTPTKPGGWSADDLKELEASSEFVAESHKELQNEADKINEEWKVIMDHTPNVDIPAGSPTSGHVPSDEEVEPLSDEVGLPA